MSNDFTTTNGARPLGRFNVLWPASLDSFKQPDMPTVKRPQGRAPFAIIATFGKVCTVLALAIAAASAQPTNNYTIDLPTTLRLAGAQNLDIKIAREKLAETRAAEESAKQQFWPYFSVGLSWRRHDNLLQDVAGNVLEVHKDSYTVGPTLAGQVELGDAIYKRLAAGQLVQAAGHAVTVQQQDTALAAAHGYFELSRAQAATAIARDVAGLLENYRAQVRAGVEAGIAFKGDELRVKTQVERNELLLRQSMEQRRVAGARLAQILRLDVAVELLAMDREPAPLAFVPVDAPLDALVRQALAARPELKQSRALVAAADEARKGAVFGPLVPTVGGQVFTGGLGGGRDGAPGRFGESEDYAVWLNWRIGPGGLFDSSRIHATKAKLNGARLGEEKWRDEIIRQVVEGRTRVQSLAEQITLARQALSTAEEVMRLTRERKQFAVGAVLEDIQAQQDFLRARLDYLNTVTEFNKVQAELQKNLGGSSGVSAGRVIQN